MAALLLALAAPALGGAEAGAPAAARAETTVQGAAAIEEAATKAAAVERVFSGGAELETLGGNAAGPDMQQAIKTLRAATERAPARDKRDRSEVLVVADAIATAEGLRPRPGQPIYYIYRQGKFDLGEAVAGTKMPGPAEIEQAVAAELAKQGFVRTEVGGPMPSILVLGIWGESAYSAAAPGEEATLTDRMLRQALRRDEGLMQNIMGIRKPTRSLADDQKVAYAMQEDRYYLTLGAYDALTFKTAPTLLWRTSMSVELRKNNFAQMLPTMLASAGPSFGVHVPESSFVDDRDRREAQVQVGEAVVVPEKKD